MGGREAEGDLEPEGNGGRDPEGGPVERKLKGDPGDREGLESSWENHAGVDIPCHSEARVGEGGGHMHGAYGGRGP